MFHWPTQSSLCHCPLANFSAYHRLKHSWYAARASAQAAAAAEDGEAVDGDGGVEPKHQDVTIDEQLHATAPKSSL